MFRKNKMFYAYRLFQKSVFFEYEQEKIYHEIFNIRGFIKLFPRSVHIYNNYKKHLFVLNYFIFVPLYVSWFFINTILIAISFFRWLPLVIKAKEQHLPERIYLSLSDFKYFSYIDRDQKNYPEAIIQFPFHTSQDNYQISITTISFVNITKILYLVEALILSLVTPILFLFSKNRSLLLYTFTSFNWYWIYFSLVRKDLKSIWLSNHYDRWVNLVNGLPKPSNKIIVQHGQLEYIENKSGKVYFPFFKNKLKNISKVYIIDDHSRKYFLEIIHNESLIFQKIKSKLKIIEWPVSFKSKLKILILGHKNDFIFHNTLILKLKKNNLFGLAYKTHPQQSIKDNINGCWLVADLHSLPEADIVISYGSSLDNEIKQLLPSAKIINYGFNEKFDMDKAIKHIESKLFL